MSANQYGCIDKVDYGNVHQLQLWLSPCGDSVAWTLRNAYVPGGKQVRSCVLDSGSDSDYSEARRLGQEVFDRTKAEELAKCQPANAAQVSSLAVVS